MALIFSSSPTTYPLHRALFSDIPPLKDGDPDFVNPGGTRPRDYAPRNALLVRDRGIPIPKLEGDVKGVAMGLDVQEDFFGNPIIGLPDHGAIATML